MTAKEQIIKRLGKEFAGNFWRWKANVFENCCYPNVGGVRISVTFQCTMTKLKAMFETEEDYAIPNEEKEFTGDEAFRECLEWTTEKIIEKSEIIKGRVKPYRKGYENYLNALRGA